MTVNYPIAIGGALEVWRSRLRLFTGRVEFMYGPLDRLDPVAYLGSMFSGIVGNRGFRKHTHSHIHVQDAGELDMCQIGYSIMNTKDSD